MSSSATRIPLRPIRKLSPRCTGWGGVRSHHISYLKHVPDHVYPFSAGLRANTKDFCCGDPLDSDPYVPMSTNRPRMLYRRRGWGMGFNDITHHIATTPHPTLFHDGQSETTPAYETPPLRGASTCEKTDQSETTAMGFGALSPTPVYQQRRYILPSEEEIRELAARESWWRNRYYSCF